MTRRKSSPKDLETCTEFILKVHRLSTATSGLKKTSKARKTSLRTCSSSSSRRDFTTRCSQKKVNLLVLPRLFKTCQFTATILTLSRCRLLLKFSSQLAGFSVMSKSISSSSNIFIRWVILRLLKSMWNHQMHSFNHSKMMMIQVILKRRHKKCVGLIMLSKVVQTKKRKLDTKVSQRRRKTS
jgi:hypothetical protein